jgi:hypothetical protein
VSRVSDAAIVRLFLADYASAEAGKLNMIGGGLGLIGNASQVSDGAPLGFTAPFVVVVSVAVPPELYGAECAVEVALEDSMGAPVSLPGPIGESQVMRVAQNVTFSEALFPGTPVPKMTLRARMQWLLTFNAGLPLSIGQRYVWRIRIDGDTRDEWTEEFFVPGPAAGPVFG